MNQIRLLDQNHNIKNLYIYPEELNIYIASGWKKGKVKK